MRYLAMRDSMTSVDYMFTKPVAGAAVPGVHG